jgi:predicted PurR-regulated permease PerM
LVLGIAQLPALLISIPAIAWLWGAGDAGTTSNIIFSVYILIAGMADNFLKPLLLGRVVDAPMPIILIGAIGGMITSGLIGLFLGAVLLAIGYQIFMEWVDEIEDIPAATADSTHKPTSGE